MSILNQGRQLFERLTGWYLRKDLPFGVDMYRDMARSFSADQVRVVLDIGANVGQSAKEYLRCFPLARIHSFEPVRATYAELRKAVVDPRFQAYHLAMGAEAGEQEIDVVQDPAFSDMNTLRGRHPFTAHAAFVKERITIGTVDSWLAAAGLGHVDLMKTDTEGFDLEVVRGAAETLRAGRIGFLLVEVGIDESNELHASYSEVMDLLRPWGYRPYGIYDQFSKGVEGGRVLRRANVLFTRPSA